MSKNSLKGRGGRLPTVETRTEPIKTKSHHCLVNNLEKILVFFSLHSPSLVKGTDQAGVLATCQDSAFAEVLLNLALCPVEDRLVIYPLRLETWPGSGSAWGFVLPL